MERPGSLVGRLPKPAEECCPLAPAMLGVTAVLPVTKTTVAAGSAGTSLLRLAALPAASKLTISQFSSWQKKKREALIWKK